MIFPSFFSICILLSILSFLDPISGLSHLKLEFSIIFLYWGSLTEHRTWSEFWKGSMNIYSRNMLMCTYVYLSIYTYISIIYMYLCVCICMFIWVSTNSSFLCLPYEFCLNFYWLITYPSRYFYYHPSGLPSLISAAVTFFLMVFYVSILALIFSILDIVIFCIKS